MKRILALVLALSTLSVVLSGTAGAVMESPSEWADPQAGCTYYDETGHNLCAGFRAYWEQYGGLAIFGYPITEEYVENGATIQYFERARFEWRPGSWPERYDVQLGLLGDNVATVHNLYGTPPFESTGKVAGCTHYEATGHNLCGGFRAYWEHYGGLAIFGYPISEEFQENGMTVQYFERQRFEWHPGEWPERWDVLLGRLGSHILPAEIFTASLTGDQEVPAVETDAYGLVHFEYNHERTELYYWINVWDIVDVRMAHIHWAPAGENGDVVAWLFPDGPPPTLIEGETNGPLAEGVITAADLVGPLAGQSLETLVEGLRNGSAYTNVHTVANGGGEIRGQIMPGRLEAHLTGDQEVPDPIDTNASGHASFQLNQDGTEIYYRLNVWNIDNVRMAHIHWAPFGENGDVVAWLFPEGPPPTLIEGTSNGLLADGVITAADLTGPLAGQPLSVLVRELIHGNTYANVHTQAHGGGEIRGQINMPGFVAELNGDQEVPAVETDASGHAVIRMSEDMSSLHYEVYVTDIENVMMAHIHLAAAGENGDVVAWLWPDGPPPGLKEGTTTGLLAEGSITSADLVGPLAGMTLSDLVTEIMAGKAYVNVHTQAFGGGEIRGQLRTSLATGTANGGNNGGGGGEHNH